MTTALIEFMAIVVSGGAFGVLIHHLWQARNFG